MAVIGVVTCEILELELARLLGNDPDIARVTVLENRASTGLIKALEASPIRDLRRLPHVHAFRSEPGDAVEVLLRVLPMSLHRSRASLGTALTAAAHELGPHVEALLLGYGLCGGALDDPRAALDVDVPVFLPMDRGHPVDDCVALCLGGRDPYYAEQCRVAGTFFLTPGWSRHWRQGLDVARGEIAQPGPSRLLAGYERALLVQTPAIARDELLRSGAEFGRRTGLRVEVREGTMELLTAAWAEAVRSVESGLVATARGASA